MFSLEVESDDESRDILIAELWEQGSTGIEETDLPGGRCLLRAFFEDEADEESLQHQFAAPIERQAPRDWVKFSQAGLEPLCVGSRFYLVPQWLPDPSPDGRFRIEINPGLACGSGYHEATQLCLEALGKYLDPSMPVPPVAPAPRILSIPPS